MKHEEVKQLKKGQTLYLPVTVTEILDSGNRIAFSVCYASRDGRTTSNISAYYEQLILPSTAADKPKYDPCRLFKKGDRVQVKKRNGRCNGKHGEYLREAFCEVAEDEVQNELVRVYHNSSEYLLDTAYLELVTPLEELGPYFVKENREEEWWEVLKRDEADGALFVSIFNTETHPNAKAAAEAERDRLNAEYRKEQNNGNK